MLRTGICCRACGESVPDRDLAHDQAAQLSIQLRVLARRPPLDALLSRQIRQPETSGASSTNQLQIEDAKNNRRDARAVSPNQDDGITAKPSETPSAMRL
jgi:hypothetical protein